MITPEQHAEIRRLYYGKHWTVGTIVTQLGVHPDTVRAAIAIDTRIVRRGACRASIRDPYLPFIRDTLTQYPRLRATRLYAMLRPRGYAGSATQLRRLVRGLRPQARVTMYRRLVVLPAEEAQVDWGTFGSIRIGHGTRSLSGFVMVLSYSCALFAHFTLDQTLESFLRGHVEAFQVFGGSARTLVYDNLKSAVLERQGTAIRFHPRLLDLAGHYRFSVRPCTPARGNEKGKVERQIRYLRDAFFAARTLRDVDDLNAQCQRWRHEIAHQRPHPEQRDQTVAQVFAQEQARLLPLPAHPFETDVMRPVVSGKLAYVRFDRNSYSIPHTHVCRPLTLLASATTVRVVAGVDELSRHARSYASGVTIEAPTHLDGLLAATQQANASSTQDRLRLAVPITATLFARLAERGDALRPHLIRLHALLDDYGPAELATAVALALARDALGAGSISHILETRRRHRGHAPPVPMTLPDRPGVRDLTITPHRLESYDDLIARATRARWSPTVLLDTLAQAELDARARRRLERQLHAARLGRFKPLADFEWAWPKHLDRATVDRVFALDFIAKGENVVLVAAQGLGKTMLTKNLLHQAVLAGHSALFITASDLLLDLSGQDTSRALERRLRAYARPQILAIDEIGYLSYNARAADLLCHVISRRYEQRATVVTTNLLFKQWDTVFPNASCAVALIDRLTHHAEIIPIEGASYRKREADLTQKTRRAAP